MEHNLLIPSLKQASNIEQSSQTLLQQNSSNSEATEEMTKNLDSKNTCKMSLCQLIKKCQFKKALSLAETKFNSKRGILGESNIKLVPLLNQMAEISISLSKYSKASELCSKSEQILKNSQQDSHYNSFLAHTYQNMALVSRGNQDYKEALELINKCSALYSRKDLQSIEIFRIKALILNDLKYYKEALEEIQKSLDIVDKSIDIEMSIEKASVYNTLGEIQFTVKNWEKAKTAYEKAIEICQKSDLNDHVEMAKACTGLGETLIEAKKISAVVSSLAESALKIYDNCFGEDRHPVRISSFLLLVKYFKQQKESSEVLEYTCMALKEAKTFYGADSEKTREVRLSAAKAAGLFQFVKTLVEPIMETGTKGKSDRELGNLYLQMCEASLFCGEYDLFGKIHKKAVKKLKKVYGDVSLEITKMYEKIARYYQRKNEEDKTIYFLGQCSEIYKELFGDNHIEIARLSLVISGIYCKKNDFPHSILYLEQALKIQIEFYEESHPEVIENEILLANAYGFNPLQTEYINIDISEISIF